MLRGSGSRENISKVSAKFIWKERWELLLTTSNISSLVIDNLCDESGEEDIAIAMFYCDFRDQKEQTATNIIGAILKQLVFRREMLEHVQKVFQKAKNEVGGRGLLLPGIVQMLKQAVVILPQVFVCIDALDECLPEHQLELLGSLESILPESRRTRIFFTGRPQVRVEITKRFTGSVTVPISPKIRDIERYLEKKLEMDSESDAMSDSLRADILRIIPQRISGMYVAESALLTSCIILYWPTTVFRFLLVSLAIGAILGEVTISERKRKLNEMTKGNHLRDVYGTTLERIKAQKGSKSRLGMDALMWVSNSERPLEASELCHALGVKIGSTDLDLENIPTIRTLIGCSLGLITVEASSSVVRLVHFTLQEYLSNNLNLFQSPHSMIAEVCLTYLNFQCVRKLSPTLGSAPSTAPFVEYASRYWGKHTRRENTERVSPLALKFLIGFEQHISSRLFLLNDYRDSRPKWDWWLYRRVWIDRPNSFTGLHAAAFLGIVEIVAALLEKKIWDINVTDTLGRTALVWAIIPGHEEVVRILLQRKDINPNTSDTQYNRTPLLWAAERGNEGVVKLLLEREDIDLNAADSGYGRTPLWWAAERGYDGIVRLLLEREDTNPNIPGPKCGRTPLLTAAIGRHERTVRLLLQRKDLNPNTPDTTYSGTPLWWASGCGYEGIVKLLLEREDTDLNTLDPEYGQTPLLRASARGHDGIVRLLLEREDTNPNIPGAKCGQTPLLAAAVGRHERTVRLLLQRKDLNPNTPVEHRSGGLRGVGMRE